MLLLMMLLVVVASALLMLRLLLLLCGGCVAVADIVFNAPMAMRTAPAHTCLSISRTPSPPSIKTKQSPDVGAQLIPNDSNLLPNISIVRPTSFTLMVWYADNGMMTDLLLLTTRRSGTQPYHSFLSRAVAKSCPGHYTFAWLVWPAPAMNPGKPTPLSAASSPARLK